MNNINEIPKADIFWDKNGWYWVDSTKTMCESICHTDIHDAIVDAIKNGYRIKGFRGTRGSVQIKGLYK